jgi:menaquinone-dependent protoporphyrinogen IX oxidase
MKTIVVYKSKTGFTKRYAEWIAKDLGCEAVSADKVSAKELQPYQTVIYGGGITAGQIGGLKKFKGVIADNLGQKLIVFATGATPAEVLKEKDTVKEANFTSEELKEIPYFYFQSGINYENMKLGGKLLMKMFSAMLSKKKDKTPEEQGMAETITKSADYSDVKFIQPLISYVRDVAPDSSVF